MVGTGKRGVPPVAEVVEGRGSRGVQAVGEGMGHSSRPSQVVGLEGAFAGIAHIEHAHWAAAAVEVIGPRVSSLIVVAPYHGLLRRTPMKELASGRGT